MPMETLLEYMVKYQHGDMQRCTQCTRFISETLHVKSSSTSRWFTLFTWKTQWKQKTQSICIPACQASAAGEIFKVMTGMGQMVPILFIWSGTVVDLTWACTIHTAVYLLDPLPTLLANSERLPCCELEKQTNLATSIADTWKSITL